MMKYVTLPNNRTVACFGEFSALDVYKDVYEDKSYIQEGLNINPGDVVVDVGANIGLWSLFVMEQVPQIKLVAVEPIPQIFEALQKNIEDHQPPESSVTALNIGLAEQEKTAKFNFYPRVPQLSSEIPFDHDHFFKSMSGSNESGNALAALLSRLRTWAAAKIWSLRHRPQEVECQLKTFSQMIDELQLGRIDFVKLDAENAEWGVIAGISEEDWPKIRQMSIEVHTNIPGGQNLVEEITALLQSKGFTVTVDFDSRFSPVGVHMMFAKRPSM
jgi:phthiocerol/phenolphthiocerol synthesis type-I polyketide synthase E